MLKEKKRKKRGKREKTLKKEKGRKKYLMKGTLSLADTYIWCFSFLFFLRNNCKKAISPGNTAHTDYPRKSNKIILFYANIMKN